MAILRFTYCILQGSDVFRHFVLITTCHTLSELFIVSQQMQTSGLRHSLLYIIVFYYTTVTVIDELYSEQKAIFMELKIIQVLSLN